MGIETAIIASAVIGAGASFAGASASAKAAKKAGQQTQQASQDAIKLQQQQYANAFQILSKYGAQGDWARNQIAAFMGAPQMRPRSTNPNAPQSGPDYAAYVRNNPDLAAEFAKPGVAQQFGGDIAKYGVYHYNQFHDHGEPPQAGGQTDPGARPGDADYKTPDQLREEAWGNYTKSPYATIARTNADTAKKDFTSAAGAQGSALSGRTARGLAEVGNQMEQQGFGSYMTGLSALADTGFQADSGIASGGQTYANNAGNIMMNAAGQQGQAWMAQADAWNSALGDAAGWAGYAAGNLYDPNNKQTTLKRSPVPTMTPDRRYSAVGAPRIQ